MPSPFPGMNPYLEQADAWHDFHERFVPHIATVIGSQLLTNYIVKIDEQVYIHEASAEQRAFLGRGDAFVADRLRGATGAATMTVGCLAAPATSRCPRSISNDFPSWKSGTNATGAL